MGIYLGIYSNKRGFLEMEVQNLVVPYIEKISVHNSMKVIYKFDINVNTQRFSWDDKAKMIKSSSHNGITYNVDEFLDLYGNDSDLAKKHADLFGFLPFIEEIPTCTCGGRVTYNESKIGPFSKENHSNYCELVTSGRAK